MTLRPPPFPCLQGDSVSLDWFWTHRNAITVENVLQTTLRRVPSTILSDFTDIFSFLATSLKHNKKYHQEIKVIIFVAVKIYCLAQYNQLSDDNSVLLNFESQRRCLCYYTWDGCMVVGLWGALASFSADSFIFASTMSAISCLSSAWCSPTRGMEEPTTCATWWEHVEVEELVCYVLIQPKVNISS